MKGHGKTEEMEIEVIEVAESEQEADSHHNTTSLQDKEVVATLAPLSTKRKWQTSMYFRDDKNQRISQREPETPPLSMIIIEESPREEERIEEIVLKENLQKE